MRLVSLKEQCQGVRHMKTLFLLLTLVISLPSSSTVTVGASDCPIEFEGKVKQIIGPVGASDFFAANKVVLENRRTLRGEVNDQVTIEILQNGPFQIESDKDYRVQLRNGKLCWIEEL
jgi:hypothetical protein